MCDIRNYIGFHGTSVNSASEIVSNGFNFNIPDEKADELLLGKGVYFFIDGIGDPRQDAYNYVVNRKKEKNPAVVKSQITAEEEYVLDLNSSDGLILFNKFKNRFFEKRVAEKRKMNKNVDDGKIINVLVGEVLKGTKVVISYRTLRLTSDDNEYNLHSNVPNCVFCCVREPNCLDDIQVVNMED